MNAKSTPKKLKVQIHRNHLTLTRGNTTAYLQQYNKTSFHLSVHKNGRTLITLPYTGTLRQALTRLVQLELFANQLPCIAQRTVPSAQQAAHFAATEPKYPSQGFLRIVHTIPLLHEVQVA